MKNVTITSVLAVLLIAPIASTQAQRQPLPVEPGARVRITTALRNLEGRRIDSTRVTVAEGLLREIRPEGFAIVAEGRPFLPVLIRGGIGAVVGAVLGAGIGLQLGRRDSTITTTRCVDRNFDILYPCQQYKTERHRIRASNDWTIYIGAAVGGVVGLLVGVFVAADAGEVPVGALRFDLGGIGRGEVSARLLLPR